MGRGTVWRGHLPLLALLVPSAAWAGKPLPFWDMPVSEPGTTQRQALAAGRLNSDAVLDYAAILQLDKATAGIALSYSGDKETFIPFGDSLAMRLATVDLNQDGVSALVLFEPLSENSGELLLTDVSKAGVFSVPLTVEGADDAMFAYDFDAADINADGVLDLLVGAPGENRVYAIDGTQTGTVELAVTPGSFWQGPPGTLERPGLGAGVLVRTRAGVDEVVLARCSLSSGSTCANSALITRPVAEVLGSPLLSEADFVAGPTFVPRQLVGVPDLDGDDVDEVLWVGDFQKILLSSAAGDAATLATITADGDDVVINQGASGPQLWVQDGGVVWVISRLEDGTAAELADDQFALKGAPLGVAIADAGDVNGDGCDDLLASTEDSTTVYLLTAPCPTDTGGPGDDTGTTGDDTGTTGDDTGTVVDDTGAVGQDSAAEVPCVPGLGWTCGGRSGLAAVLLLGLVGLLRRVDRRAGGRG